MESVLFQWFSTVLRKQEKSRQDCAEIPEEKMPELAEVDDTVAPVPKGIKAEGGRRLLTVLSLSVIFCPRFPAAERSCPGR